MSEEDQIPDEVLEIVKQAEERVEVRKNIREDDEYMDSISGLSQDRQERIIKSRVKAIINQRRIEERNKKIRTGEYVIDNNLLQAERTINYFNGLAAINLEHVRHESRDNDKKGRAQREKYPKIFLGQTPDFNISYQVATEKSASRPKFKTDSGEEVDVVARLFVKPREKKEGATGNLYILDTNGQWYQSEITCQNIDAKVGVSTWSHRQGAKKVENPEMIAEMIEDSK